MFLIQYSMNMILSVITLFNVLQLSFVKGNKDNKTLQLPEGSKCSWKGVDGVCATPYKCRSVMQDIHDMDYPPICSYKGVQPIICCTDCELEDISLTPYTINVGVPVWYYKTGRKANDHCLDYLEFQGDKCEPGTLFVYRKTKHETKNCYDVYATETAVAGGEDANRAQFRHMALLGYGADIVSAQWICGGSLISNKFILTAGHCTSSPKFGPVRYAALGILKRSDPQELWQHYEVKRIVRHPQYKPPSKYHDIALLETATDVLFNAYVLPACLQFLSYPGLGLEDGATAVGWGALGSNGKLADTLQFVDLDEFKEPECRRLYPQHRHLSHGYNHTTQMCYGNRQKIGDTCQGDSGGPLQTIYYISECVYTILGVTSSGGTCGVAGSSGLYTRVIEYVPWIESIVWPN